MVAVSDYLLVPSLVTYFDKVRISWSWVPPCSEKDGGVLSNYDEPFQILLNSKPVESSVALKFVFGDFLPVVSKPVFALAD